MTTSGEQSPAIISGHDATVNITNNVALTDAQADRIVDKLLQRPQSSGRPPNPAISDSLPETLKRIAHDANGGDDRLKHALALIEQGNLEKATPLLRQVAEEKGKESKSSGITAATAYRTLGDISYFTDQKSALEAYKRALNFNPNDERSLLAAGQIEVNRDETVNAKTHLTLASILAPSASYVKFWSLEFLGNLYYQTADYDVALQYYERALDVAQSKAKLVPNKVVREVLVARTSIATTFSTRGDLVHALNELRDIKSIQELIVAQYPLNRDMETDAARTSGRMADIYMEQNDLESALRELYNMQTIFTRVQIINGKDTRVERDQELCVDRIAMILALEGKFSRALNALADAKRIAMQLADSDPDNLNWRLDLAATYEEIGDITTMQSGKNDARKVLRLALGISDGVLLRNPDDMRTNVLRAKIYWDLGKVEDDNDRADLNAALSILRKLNNASHLAASLDWIPAIEKDIANLRH